MKARGTLLLGALAALGGAAQPASSPAGTEDWFVYQDDMFAVRYPPGSDVSRPLGGKQDPAHPTLGVVPPAARKERDIDGALQLQPDPKTTGQPLPAALASAIEAERHGSGAVVDGPRAFKSLNGLCLGAVVIAPAATCPEGKGQCYSATYVVKCDGPGGRRYDVSTDLAGGYDPRALSPAARQQAATFALMMDSLEFKAPR